MANKFNEKEKKKFMYKKYLKEHAFEFILDMFLSIVFVVLILFLCEGKRYDLGVILAIAYSLGKSLGKMNNYKKDYLNVDIK